jgi:predicted nucleic acid-binding protein
MTATDVGERAEDFSLLPTGTCGLLVEFKRQKIINEITPLIAKLIEDFDDYRISKAVLRDCLKRADELEFLNKLLNLIEKNKSLRLKGKK